MPTVIILVATILRGSQTGLATRLVAGVTLPGVMPSASTEHPLLQSQATTKQAASGKRGDFSFYLQTIAEVRQPMSEGCSGPLSEANFSFLVAIYMKSPERFFESLGT